MVRGWQLQRAGWWHFDHGRNADGRFQALAHELEHQATVLLRIPSERKITTKTNILLANILLLAMFIIIIINM